jgi:hypothetical protein
MLHGTVRSQGLQPIGATPLLAVVAEGVSDAIAVARARIGLVVAVVAEE